MHHRDGDRVVERHHRVVRHPLEQAVERQDLRPVRVLGARRLVVHGGNRRLQLIRADRAARQRRRDQRDAFRDRPPIPQRAILLVERNQLAVSAGSRAAAGVGQQHQRQQPGDLAVGRQQMMDRPGEPNRFVRQVAALQVGADAARVALVEDQVEHVQDGAEPLAALVPGGHAEGHARRLDPLLGAADPLRHRRLGHQERVRDLGGGQSADRSQRQGNGRRASERGMTAHEEQDQRVVLIHLIGPRRRRSLSEIGERRCVRRWRDLQIGRRLRDDQRLATAAREIGADVVGHAPRGDVNQPAARVVGHAFVRPLERGGEQRLLHRVLGGGEVAEAADHRAENLRRQFAQQVLARRIERRVVTLPRAARSSPGAPRSACSAARRRARAPRTHAPAIS